MRHRGGGFTLLELVLVIAIIGLAVGLALPQFMPALAASSLEGSARHLANFGRGAVTRAAFSHERYTFRCDLARNEYWLVRWKEVEPEGEKEEDKEEGLFKKDNLFGARGGRSGNSSLFDIASQFTGQSAGLDALIADSMPEGFEEKAEEMQERFDRFAQLALMTRARNVKHEGILGEIGPLFEKEFTLETDGQKEDDYEEMKDPLLLRTSLPAGVRIESVQVGNAAAGKGITEVEITPLGFAEPVTFYLRNDDGDYYTVVWDAITGGAHLYAGKRADA